jgi:hypothetical protein
VCWFYGARPNVADRPQPNVRAVDLPNPQQAKPRRRGMKKINVIGGGVSRVAAQVKASRIYCELSHSHDSLPEQDADALAFEIAGDDVEFAVAVHVGDCELPNSSTGQKRRARRRREVTAAVA